MSEIIRHGDPLMPSPEKLEDLQERLAQKMHADASTASWGDLSEQERHKFRGYAASALMWMRETVQMALGRQA
jgi:hypothetical protein